MTGVYGIPALYATFRAPLTNCTPVGFVPRRRTSRHRLRRRRLVNQAAMELNVDPPNCAGINFIPPDAFPYKRRPDSVVRSCRFARLLKQALKLGGLEGFANARAKSASTANCAASACRP